MYNLENILEIWKNNIENAEDLKILNNLSDDDIYESFYKDLEFGTAGLRGIMGMGTNRINIYTVRRTTQGLANYLKDKYKSLSDKMSVAISYDSRKNSYEFAKEVACVLGANDIRAYITDELQPTPVLSFLVRQLRCIAGVMITASHNPPEYNGYKCYGDDGAQVLDDEALKIYEHISNVEIFKDVKTIDYEHGLRSGKIELVNEENYDKYIDCVLKQGINTESCRNSDLSVVYTPLNGAGNKMVRKVAEKIGIKKIYVVPQQESPDGDFTTCKYPNPEFEESFTLAKKLGKEKKSDLIISTDPDCDRIGVCVFDGKDYIFLTGNQIGVLLASYILKYRDFIGNLPKNPVIVKTIVSTNFVDKIARKYRCKVVNVLTGFKYIGKEISKLEQKNEEERYILGFEESHGYLVGTYARDKDAVVTAMLMCEMAAFYKREGQTLLDVLEDIYREFGKFYAKNINIKFSENKSDMDRIGNIMENLRKNGPDRIGGLNILSTRDYLIGTYENLPKSNVIYYELENDSTVIIRPSGTEPKIKIYVMSDSAELLNNICKDINNILNTESMERVRQLTYKT